MLYHSTRSKENMVDSAQAVLNGLAPDGGLYVPEKLPQVDVAACLREDTFQMAARLIGAMLPDVPEMEDIFRGIKIEAYYPDGNETWKNNLKMY